MHPRFEGVFWTEGRDMKRSTEIELESVLDSTHCGIVALDQSGIISFFNRTAEKIFDVPSRIAVNRQVIGIAFIQNSHLSV